MLKTLFTGCVYFTYRAVSGFIAPMRPAAFATRSRPIDSSEEKKTRKHKISKRSAMQQIQKPIRPRLMNEDSPTFHTHRGRTSTPIRQNTRSCIYSYLSGPFVTSASAFPRETASVDSPSTMLSHRASPLSPVDALGVSANACMTTTYQYLCLVSSAGSSTKLWPYLLELLSSFGAGFVCVFSWPPL